MVGLDRLPIELIHKIFNYLHSYDIFTSLYNINTYINTTIHAYDRYQLNFESIPRSNFDLLLRCIRPSQVISLILSNMDDTPGQYQLFLSLFTLKQFVRLQNLRLIQPSNPIDLNQILTDLHTLNSLQSLSIIHCPPISVNQETFFIFASFLNSSTSLRRLSLSGTLNTLFEYHFLSSINHLYFNDNIFNTIPLQIINTCMPYLKSLDTAITSKIHSIHFPSFRHLTRLTLTVFIDMKNSEMKTLLNLMLSLEFLKITANGKQWFDGHFWEECLPLNLQVFQFNFCTQAIHINEEMIFETFQTSFWMHKKHWYVMLDYQMNPTMTHLYSLPYCDTQFYYRPTGDPNRKCRSSIPMKNSDLDNVTKVTIDLSAFVIESNVVIPSTHFFSNISKLVLSDTAHHLFLEPLFNFLKSTLNLHRIVELTLGQFHHPDLIEILYNHMPKLRSLRMRESMMMKLEKMNFRSITTLSICDCLTNIERMYSMFPFVKYLCIKVTNFEQMKQVIELYEKSLINVTFRLINHDLQGQFIPWLFKYSDESRRFTYDIDEHMNLHIWLTDSSM